MMTMGGLVKRGNWKVGRELTGAGDGVEGSAGDVWQGREGARGSHGESDSRCGDRERGSGREEGKERRRTHAYILHTCKCVCVWV